MSERWWLLVDAEGEPVHIEVAQAGADIPTAQHEGNRVLTVVPADQLAGAVEDRDKLAAYLLWTFDPEEGRAPMSFGEMRALLDRIGGQ